MGAKPGVVKGAAAFGRLVVAGGNVVVAGATEAFAAGAVAAGGGGGVVWPKEVSAKVKAESEATVSSFFIGLRKGLMTSPNLDEGIYPQSSDDESSKSFLILVSSYSAHE